MYFLNLSSACEVWLWDKNYSVPRAGVVHPPGLPVTVEFWCAPHFVVFAWIVVISIMFFFNFYFIAISFFGQT